MLYSPFVQAQIIDPFDVESIKAKAHHQTKELHEVEKSSGTLKILINTMFIGYKRYVSSQDASSCNFYPSCSVYFVQAVSLSGFVKGSLLFGDRFQRCNSLNRKNYPLYSNTTLLYDPVPCDHSSDKRK